MAATNQIKILRALTRLFYVLIEVIEAPLTLLWSMLGPYTIEDANCTHIERGCSMHGLRCSARHTWKELRSY